MQITLRKLIETAVRGIKEYQDHHEIQKMVDFICDWSTLQVAENYILLNSASQFGVGDTRNKVLEVPKYLTFYWGQSEILEDTPIKGVIKGLPSRQWQLQSYQNLETLESFLKSRGTMSSNFYPYSKGMIVVLINGVVEEFEIIKCDRKDGYASLSINDILWENLKPYELTFEMSGERIVETYSSKRIVELRILQVLKDGGERPQVYNLFDTKPIHFTIREDKYDSREPLAQSETNLIWYHWGMDDAFEEEGECEQC